MRPERQVGGTSGMAVASLFVGIVGVVPFPILGLALRHIAFVPPVPPFVLPALAMYLSGRALREIASSSGVLLGRRLALAGRALGIIGMVLSMLFVVSCIAVLSKT